MKDPIITVQVERDASEYLPATQSEQAVAEVELMYCPPGQLVHRVELDVAE